MIRMKYNAWLICLCLCMTGYIGVTAQVQLGVKGGINLAHWTTRESNSLTGIHAGVTAYFPMSEKLSVQADILYSGKGTGLSNYIPGNPMEFTLQYLSLPVLLQYQVGKVKLGIGPEVSKLLTSKIEVNQMEQDVPEAFDDWDIGIAGGVTLGITESISVQIRYIMGLDDIVLLRFTDENGQDLGQLSEGKNRVLQFGIQYLF